MRGTVAPIDQGSATDDDPPSCRTRRRDAAPLGRVLGMSDATVLLTIAEAADRLSVSQRTVERLLAERRIRRVKIGRRTLITSREVEGYIANAGRRVA